MWKVQNDVLVNADTKIKVKPQIINPGLLSLSDYPILLNPAPLNCFIPCNGENKPMIKWGDGAYTKENLMGLHFTYIGINNKGQHRIVIDIDGDHGKNIDEEVIDFGYSWQGITTIMWSPRKLEDGRCPSFHIIFRTNREIPTMHFKRLDIIGNQQNTLQYLKTKKSDGVPMKELTEEDWNKICEFIERRKNNGTES